MLESAPRLWARFIADVMSDTDASLRNYYAARAGEYERVYAKPERQADLARLKEMLPPMFADRRVLEVACGTAYWTQFLAQTANSITAVDANVETLQVAAGKAWPDGRVRFITADAYALPAELGMFDAAFAGFWWSHVPVRERARFFDSLDQRLAPHAKVVLLDNLFVAGSSTPISHRDDDGNTYQHRRLDDGSEHVVLKNFPTASGLSADIRVYGRDPQFIAFDYYWIFSYVKGPAA